MRVADIQLAEIDQPVEFIRLRESLAEVSATESAREFGGQYTFLLRTLIGLSFGNGHTAPWFPAIKLAVYLIRKPAGCYPQCRLPDHGRHSKQSRFTSCPVVPIYKENVPC